MHMHLAMYRKLKIHISCEQKVKLQPASCEPLPKLHECHKYPLRNYISNIYCMSDHIYDSHVCAIMSQSSHLHHINLIFIEFNYTYIQQIH